MWGAMVSSKRTLNLLGASVDKDEIRFYQEWVRKDYPQMRQKRNVVIMAGQRSMLVKERKNHVHLIISNRGVAFCESYYML